MHDDLDWRERAACRGVGVDVFFTPEWDRPEGMTDKQWAGYYRGLTNDYELTAKIRYCALCPVRSPCAAIGWKDDDGVFGGLSARERRDIDSGRPVGTRGVRALVSPTRDKIVKMFQDGEDIDSIREKTGVTRVTAYLREYLALLTQSNVE